MGNIKKAKAAYMHAVTLSDRYLDEYTPIYNMAHTAYDEIKYHSDFEQEKSLKVEEVAPLQS